MVESRWLPELRHDFRRYYGCRYDDVPNEEAVDLVRMLPDGSRYVASRWPERSWPPERHRAADLLDAVKEIAWALVYDREKVPSPPTVVRPADAVARQRDAARAARARRAVESESWEEM